jgi:hypothetical protein
MPLDLQPSSVSQLEDIAGLLCEAFAAPRDARFADPDLLKWKYFDSAAVWERPCSYVLRESEALAAHCALAPIKLLVPGRPAISGVCFMDWVSSRQMPYAGLVLKKRLLSSADIAIVTGGTAATRALIPKLGFAIHASVETFARVVRPWRQWRTRPHTSTWKDAARLARNVVWSRAPLGRVSRDWQALPVERFTEATNMDSGLTLPEHGADLLNYWLRCPSAEVSGYEIRISGARSGHFLISRIGGQARIADLRLTSMGPLEWEMAYRLAARTAAEHPATCEVVALASTPLASDALVACGFRSRGTTPLSIYDPAQRLSGAPPLHWSYIDNDAGYLYDPASPFST